jgi:hypothetical protein
MIPIMERLYQKRARGRGLLPAEILTPAWFGFSGGEYLARRLLPIGEFLSVIVGMFYS